MNNFPRKQQQSSGWPELSETITPPRIDFLAEQTGEAEEQLKNSLRRFYAEFPRVRRAYLVQASFGEPPVCSVILCERFVEHFEKIYLRSYKHTFNEISRRRNFYDWLLLDENREQELRKVCKPFYEPT